MKGMIAAALLVGAAMGLAIESPAAAAAPETKAPATAVPIAAFAQFPELQSPRISPGGKVIAVKVRIDGRQALAIVPIGAGSKIEVIGKDGDFDKQEDLVIRSWRWADDDNLLIALSSRQNFFGQWFDATRLVGYNRTTRAVTPLAWRGSKFSASRILWMSHEGRPTILLERTPENDDTEKLGLPEVIKVDVVSGKIESVQRQMPGIHGWYADGKGVVRLGVGSDGDSGKRLVMYRAAAGDNLHTIFSGRVGVLDEVVMPDIFLKEGNKAIALSRRDNYRAVYELDLSDMKLGKKLFGVPGYDVAGISGGLADDHLEAAYWEDQRERATYFDPRLKEIQDVLEETFGKGNVLIASADRARETIIAYVSKPGAPGGYYVFSTVTGGVGLLGWVNAAIKDAPLNPVRTIRYKASDGKDIEAVLTMPRLRAGQKNLPLIVLTHGGPFGTRDNEDWEYVPWAQPLAELGYAVVQPNYRGSTGYGGEWEKASTGNWGLRMQDDLNDAVAHLAQQGV
ncbi:MAG TPA: prolyl oligopeptidase family serine peptidase, partial [Allosphingosinicella sp.]|nr:prolyl oligopeptidase family serine peptidase [Allosphingosinicella sp.]